MRFPHIHRTKRNSQGGIDQGSVVGRLLAGRPSRRAGSSLLWHYTTVDNFITSLDGNALLPAVADAFPSEMPVLWFSQRQDVDCVAFSSWRADEHAPRACPDGWNPVPNVRIGVVAHQALVSWSVHRISGGIPERAAELQEAAWKRAGGFPDLWLGSYDAVPRSSWVVIEVLVTTLWMPLDPRITTSAVLHSLSADCDIARAAL